MSEWRRFPPSPELKAAVDWWLRLASVPETAPSCFCPQIVSNGITSVFTDLRVYRQEAYFQSARLR
jgi:hypothetical protein